MWKKKSFFLLEMLIALFLLSLLALPWMTHTLSLLRQQLQQVQEMELERVAEISFCQIYEKLQKQQIPWEKMSPQGFSAPLEEMGTEEQIHLFHQSFPIQRSFSIHLKREKQGNEGIYKQIQVTLFLAHKHQTKQFTRDFLLQKKEVFKNSFLSYSSVQEDKGALCNRMPNFY